MGGTRRPRNHDQRARHDHRSGPDPRRAGRHAGRLRHHALTELRADAGAIANDFLAQFQSDLLGVPVLRPQVTETTALGAAYLAGLATGFWSSREDIAQHWALGCRFEPNMLDVKGEALYQGWKQAVEATMGYLV